MSLDLFAVGDHCSCASCKRIRLLYHKTMTSAHFQTLVVSLLKLHRVSEDWHTPTLSADDEDMALSESSSNLPTSGEFVLSTNPHRFSPIAR